MNTTWAYRTLLVMLVAIAPGCAAGRLITGTPDFKQVQIRYHLQGNLLDQKPQPSPVQPVAAGGEPAVMVMPSSDPDKQYVRTLDLVYPYPAGSDKALAILRTVASTNTSSVAGVSGFARRNSNEILSLSIRRRDIDAILRELKSEGYFEGETKVQPGVTLTTVLDGQHRSTSWVRSDRLDTLAQRLMSRGQRVDATEVPELLASIAAADGNRQGRPPRGAGSTPTGPVPGAQQPAATMPANGQPTHGAQPQPTYPLPEPTAYRQLGSPAAAQAQMPHSPIAPGAQGYPQAYPTYPTTASYPSPMPHASVPAAHAPGGYPHAMAPPAWGQAVPTPQHQ